MKNLITLILILIICSSYGPPNCNLYKNNDDCFNACKEAEKAITHPQGSKASQILFDQSIRSCPTFDYSHYEKAVPYAKRGLMKEWKTMIDKAVELDPQEHLATRGWYHFFFMHNYEEAIKDIDALDKIINYDIGYTGDAMYHLNIMKALCYKGLGKTEEAIKIFNNQMKKEDHDIGQYDYLHLGVLYLKNKAYNKALETLNLQIEYDDISEIYFYKALCYKNLGMLSEYQKHLKQALKQYEKGFKMYNSYTTLVDEIFLSTIKDEIALSVE